MIWVQTQPKSQSTCGLEIQHGYSRLSDKISLLDKHVTIHTVPWPHALLFLLPPHISSSLWSVFLHVRPTAIPGCFFLFLWAEVSCSRPKLSSKSLSTSTYVRLFPSTVLFFFFKSSKLSQWGHVVWFRFHCCSGVHPSFILFLFSVMFENVTLTLQAVNRLCWFILYKQHVLDISSVSLLVLNTAVLFWGGFLVPFQGLRTECVVTLYRGKFLICVIGPHK